jgi:hypothetical protein
MYLGGRGGEGSGGVGKAHTPLEQLLDEIKFQRRKELRSFSQVCHRSYFFIIGLCWQRTKKNFS